MEDLEENPCDSSQGAGYSQDETNFLPLGQGSPPFQSTQAGSMDPTVRDVPDLSLDLSRIQGSQGSSSSGTEAGNAEALEDQSSGFILPPKRVKALHHKQKQAKKTQEDLIPVSEDGDVLPCRFFLKGSCKFVFFSGKGNPTKANVLSNTRNRAGDSWIMALDWGVAPRGNPAKLPIPKCATSQCPLDPAPTSRMGQDAQEAIMSGGLSTPHLNL
jgi:hypothetical protein